MQPASFLTTVIAATAVGTAIQQPLIEVWLRKWENRTNSKIELCTLVKVSPIKVLMQKPPLVALDPGDQNVNMLVYSAQNQTSSFCSNLKAISLANEAINLGFQFNFYDVGAFQIGCVRTELIDGVSHSNTLLDERIIWERAHAPEYIEIEIDGTIVQEDLRNTIFKVTQVKKEKLV